MTDPFLHLLVWLQTAELRRDDRGQTAAEYLGLIVLVGAIVIAITKLDIGNQIGAAIGARVKAIAGLGGGK